MRKGFQPEERDHTFYRFVAYGKKTPVLTKISHGATECSKFLLSQMAKQVHLSSEQFGRLLNCPMTVEEYARILCDEGILDPQEIPQLHLDDIAAASNQGEYGRRSG